MESKISLYPPTFGEFKPRDPQRAVAVMMSGGVDSSVTALVLKEAGFEVVGVTMKIPMAEQCVHPSPCCGSEAAFVCRDIGVPHYFVEVADAFEAEIIAPFRDDYRRGRTPSPCIDCNTRLKFGLLWDLVEAAFNIRRVATGHYAVVTVDEEGEAFLSMGEDRRRDQSYFLYGVPRERLPDLLLPLGTWEKDKVREKAAAHGLKSSGRPDSMELCFAGEGDYRNALGDALGPPGEIVDASGKVLGRHTGLHNYTLGQRRGIGVASHAPLFVTAIDTGTNRLVVGARDEVSADHVCIDGLNILQPAACVNGARLFAKIRSTMAPVDCTLGEVGASAATVYFDEPVFAPAPGQHLVAYDAENRIVMGGKLR